MACAWPARGLRVACAWPVRGLRRFPRSRRAQRMWRLLMPYYTYTMWRLLIPYYTYTMWRLRLLERGSLRWSLVAGGLLRMSAAE